MLGRDKQMQQEHAYMYVLYVIAEEGRIVGMSYYVRFRTT